MTRFYRYLFATSRPLQSHFLSKSFLVVEDLVLSAMDFRVTNDEIHQTISRMGGFKALDSGGLQTVFYQDQWEIVCPSRCRPVTDISQNSKRVATVNQTLIALIPKVELMVYMK